MARTEREDTQLNEATRLRIQREDLSWLMTERAGRRIVWLLLEEAGVFRSSFTGDAEGTFFAEGRRALGLSWLAKILASSRDEFVLMLKEHEEDAAA